MPYYNVKTIQYPDSLQVRTFTRPVKTSLERINSSPNVWTAPNTSNTETRERTQEQILHSLKSSVNRTVNQIYSISRSNTWQYFITLTIDPKKLDNCNYSLVLEKLSKWVNNLKFRYAPDLKYIFVPELHKDKAKWHFHGLFSDIGSIPFSFSGKVCVGKYIYDYVRKPYATKIFNIPLWDYGFSTATKIRDTSRASSYITKYITKDVSRIIENKHRYLASTNLDKPIERVYNIPYEAVEQLKLFYSDKLDYVSNISVPDAGQRITYMEFNTKTGGNDYV